ncbi:MAG TPA: hypothetical protein VJA47_03575, partial [archaeon]|nr:hypothetical protein [archaeon]
MERFIEKLLGSELFSEEFSASGRVLTVEADKVSIQITDFPTLSGSPAKGVTGVGYHDTKLDVQLGQTPKLVLLHGENADISRIVMDEGSKKRFLGVVNKGAVDVVYSMDSPRIKAVKGEGEFVFQYVGWEQVDKADAPVVKPEKPAAVPKAADLVAKHVLGKAEGSAMDTGSEPAIGKVEEGDGPVKKLYSRPTLQEIDLKDKKITKDDFKKVSGKGERTVYQYFWMRRIETPTFNDLANYLVKMKATDEERNQAEGRFVDFIVDYLGSVETDTQGLEAGSGEQGIDAEPYVDNDKRRTRQADGEHGSPTKGLEIDDTISIKEMLSLAGVHKVTLFRHIKKYGIEKHPGLGMYNRPQFMEYLTRKDLGEPLELDLNGQYLPLVPVARALRIELQNLRTTLEGRSDIELNDGQVNRDHFEKFVVKFIGSQARPKAETALLVIGYGRDRIAKI